MPKYSVQFNGSTQYLSTPRILDNSTDTTIEAWIYLTATPAANGAFILGQYVGAGADRTIFNVDSTLKVGFQVGAVSMASTTTLALNRWYHVAAVRSGSSTNNFSLYINGTREGQMTYTGTFQNTNTTIGYTPNLANTYLTGYISNFRIVKGTAVYTSNFTAPADPLTAVSNTALLTCNDTTIIDGSGNNVTITATDSPTVSTFVPYLGGIGRKRSISFNGTTQYLTLAHDSAFNFGASNFTIECWLNLTNYTSAQSIFTKRAVATASPSEVQLYVFNGGLTLYASSDGSTFFINGVGTTTGSFASNSWNHIALVRNGSEFSGYINGVKNIFGSSASTLMTNTASVAISSDQASSFRNGVAGSISNYRIVKGVAIYTASFAVPTSPLAAITNTILLAAHEDTIIDGSTNNFSITASASPTVSEFSPFYVGGLSLRNTAVQGYSVSLNGTNQYYTVPNTSSLAFGSGDYNIEAWVYHTTNTGRAFVSGTTAGNYFCFIVEAGKLVTGRVGFAGAEELISTATVPLNTWVHLAGSRQSGTARIFINGVLDKSGTITTNYLASPSVYYLGSDSSNYTNGYISNLRVVKGTAIYTASFTVPTNPLTAVANTQLLTFNASTVRDASSNNLTMTAVGAPPVSSSITPFGPNYSNRLAFKKTVPTSYSVQFNGTSALSLTGKSLSGQNFTIEGWAYFNTFTTYDSPHMFNFGTNQNNRYLVWRNNGTGKFNLGVVSAGTYTLTDGLTTPVTGSWYHLAMVRSGSLNYLYVNGIREATSSAAINTGSSWAIGRNQFDPQVSTHISGYISNFRVVTGSALYASDFTPPNEPLRVISNTALLTCNNSTIIDSSTNNYTITVSGSAASNTVIPDTINNVPTLKIYSVT